MDTHIEEKTIVVGRVAEMLQKHFVGILNHFIDGEYVCKCVRDEVKRSINEVTDEKFSESLAYRIADLFGDSYEMMQLRDRIKQLERENEHLTQVINRGYH